MSQQAEQGQESTPVIGLAGKRKWGYSVEQVDEYLAHAHEQYEHDDSSLTQASIQTQSFDLERNGYIIGQVDAALVRLEKAVVDKQTLWDITHNGQQQWSDETARLAATLRERAEREPLARFTAAERGEIGYNKKQVDKLVDQAWDLIARTLSLPLSSTEQINSTTDLSAAAVSNVIFTQRKGKKGYEESSVDAYLNRVVQVLTRFESIDRVQGADVTPEHAQEHSEDIPAAASVLSAPVEDTENTMPVSFPPASVDQVDDVEEEPTESSAESTQQFSPFDFSQQADQEVPSPETSTEEAQASSSLAHLVASHDDQAEPQTDTHEEPVQVEPEESQSASAASEPEETTHIVSEEPEDSSESEPEAASPTPEEKPSASAEDYISSVLSGINVQTSNFEIPNLTFGEATKDENEKRETAGPDSDTHDDLPSAHHSE